MKIYFDSFDIEHVPKEIKRFIRHKNIKTNIFRIQADNSIMCGYFCIGFTGKSLPATSGGISIISFTGVIGIPAGLAIASFTFVFSLTTGIIKNLLKVTRKKK